MPSCPSIISFEYWLMKSHSGLFNEQDLMRLPSEQMQGTRDPHQSLKSLSHIKFMAEDWEQRRTFIHDSLQCTSNSNQMIND